MRWILLLLLVPSALGQAVFDDPVGDHEMGMYVDGSPPPFWLGAGDVGWFPYVDVEQVGIVEETETHLVFRLQVASRDPGNEPAEYVRAEISLPFTFHGDEMQANFEFWPEWGGAVLRVGHVEEHTWGGVTYRFLSGSYAVQAEWTENVLEARFPKEWLLDRELVPARAGDVLEDISATASTRRWGGCTPPRDCWTARDLIEGTQSLQLTKDPPGVGHLMLRAEVPNRASNGAATTYLYNMSLRNIGDIDDRVTIQVGGQPRDWVVHAPSTLVIARGETVDFPVAVSVPFKHTHGEKETMQVRVASTSRAGIEAVGEVGVIWHEVPQPGGHHPDLYLHTDGWNGWMNTLEDDPQAEPDGAMGGYEAHGGGQTEARFRLPLSPRLAMGLDFIPNQTVAVDLPVQSPRDMNATIELALRLSGGGSRDLAHHSFQIDLTEGSNRVTTQVPLASGVDRIPFDPDNRLEFELIIRYDEPADLLPTGTEGPQLLTDGARLTLPLQDYHDIVDEDLLAGLGRLSVRPIDDPQRLVNPGRTAAIGFEAANADTRRATVDWRLEGTHADWGAVVPAASVVPGGGNVSVLVTVSPPAGAKDGDVAQLLLIGQSRSDPDVQVFARLVATVTETADIPDESVQAQDLAQDARKSEAKQSPGLGIVLAAVILGLALRRR